MQRRVADMEKETGLLQEQVNMLDQGSAARRTQIAELERDRDNLVREVRYVLSVCLCDVCICVCVCVCVCTHASRDGSFVQQKRVCIQPWLCKYKSVIDSYNIYVYMCIHRHTCTRRAKRGETAAAT